MHALKEILVVNRISIFTTKSGCRGHTLTVDSPTYNNIYLEKSDNSELLLAKNVPAGSRVMSP